MRSPDTAWGVRQRQLGPCSKPCPPPPRLARQNLRKLPGASPPPAWRPRAAAPLCSAGRGRLPGALCRLHRCVRGGTQRRAVRRQRGCAGAAPAGSNPPRLPHSRPRRRASKPGQRVAAHGRLARLRLAAPSGPPHPALLTPLLPRPPGRRPFRRLEVRAVTRWARCGHDPGPQAHGYGRVRPHHEGEPGGGRAGVRCLPAWADGKRCGTPYGHGKRVPAPSCVAQAILTACRQLVRRRCQPAPPQFWRRVRRPPVFPSLSRPPTPPPTQAGGFVADGRVNGSLNLSRALGDLEYKQTKELGPEEQARGAGAARRASACLPLTPCYAWQHARAAGAGSRANWSCRRHLLALRRLPSATPPPRSAARSAQPGWPPHPTPTPACRWSPPCRRSAARRCSPATSSSSSPATAFGTCSPTRRCVLGPRAAGRHRASLACFPGWPWLARLPANGSMPAGVCGCACPVPCLPGGCSQPCLRRPARLLRPFVSRHVAGCLVASSAALLARR